MTNYGGEVLGLATTLPATSALVLYEKHSNPIIVTLLIGLTITMLIFNTATIIRYLINRRDK